MESANDTLTTLETVTALFQSYAATPISDEVSEFDGMLNKTRTNPIGAYLRVGRSAIEVIARAMILANKPDVASVLDLPSGGGRVTRHLAAFLPHAELFVSELDKRLQSFAAKTFGATPLDIPVNFSEPPPRAFDLIFVGSLVTHFDAPMFLHATQWFIDALATEGILVLTTHGRRHDFIESRYFKYVPAAEWQRVADSVRRTGFGFTQTEERGGTPYGFSWSAPSWLMQAAAPNPEVRILAFQEAAWNDHQDVLLLQKRRLDNERLR